MKKNYCTIFTPTYNRVNLLHKLYKSLLEQDCLDFEWLIVDDGSNDKTREYVEQIIKEKKIKIYYYYQENGGKHTAINNGIEKANGEYFAIVDSDDYLLKNAISKIKSAFASIKQEKNINSYAGVVFNKGYSDNQMVGTSFERNFLDILNTERKKYNISGDKFEIFYTEVLKKYKFPCFKGEKFVTEELVWNRIARDNYYLRFFQDIIYICTYLDMGLSNNIYKVLEKSPKGYALNIREQVKYDNISFLKKIKEYSLYYSVRKNYVSLNEIAKEIDANKYFIYFSYLIRKLYFWFKGKKI